MPRIIVTLLLIMTAIAYSTLPQAGRLQLALAENCPTSTHGPITIDEPGRTGTITLAVSCTVPHSGVNGVSDWSVDWGDGSVDYTPSFNASDPSVGVGCYNDPINGQLCFPCSTCPLIGSHPYREEGTYTVTVSYQAGCCHKPQSSFTVTVRDPDPVNVDPAMNGGVGTPRNLSVIENIAFSDRVAVFQDAGSINDFSAAIDWGDGTPRTTGAIAKIGFDCSPYCSIGYEVTGSHLYSGPAGSNYPVTTSVSDDGGGHVNLTSTMSILDADLTASPMSLDAVALRPFSGGLAGFTDADPLAAASKYTAAIDWGDATALDSSAAIAAGGGTFTVNGMHTYGAGGSYTLAVTIKDKNGASASVNTGSAHVTNPAPTITSLSPGTVKAGGNAFTLTVNGTDFVPGALVRWNGVTLPAETTTRVSAAQLTALVPDADFVTAKTAQITVVNPLPGGGATAVYPFFVTVAAAGLTSVNTATSTSSGGDANASVGGTGPATAGSISISGHTGTGTVAVATYAEDPGASPSFRANGVYFDVFVAPGSTFAKLIVTDCNLNGGTTAYWLNNGAWAAVAGDAQSYNAATKCLTFTLANSTHPSLDQLTGTILAGGLPPTISAVVTTADGKAFSPGANTWANQSVSVAFTCDPAIATLTTSAAVPSRNPVVLGGDGARQRATGTCSVGGDTPTSTTIEGINIDTSPPVVQLTGPQAGATYTGVVPKPVCSATDALSGVATQPTVSSLSSPVAGSPGKFKEVDTCAGAIDAAGNRAAPVTVTYYFTRRINQF